MSNIISEKYRDLETFSSEKKNLFIKAKPFPFIELDNFFDEDYLNGILESFPKMSENKHDFNMNTKAEVKLAISSPDRIPSKINCKQTFFSSFKKMFVWHLFMSIFRIKLVYFKLPPIFNSILIL